MNLPFSQELAGCAGCPRRCGVNRLAGEKGFCRIGSDLPLVHAGLHFGEEPPISGNRGSGTIFFAGCNLRCIYCQNHQISQEFHRHPVLGLTPENLAGEMLRLETLGAHNINLVSPSHVVFQAADAIVAAREEGLSVPVVYNSNGYDSVDALRRIRGLVEIYLPDIKYSDDALGRELSGADDYAGTIPGVLGEMLDQAGPLTMNGEGIAVRGLLVRHLVLPGYLENSRKCLRLIADLSREIPVSIMSQYAPRYRAGNHPRIGRGLTEAEYAEITDFALDVGLENAFVQETESRDHYLPDFDRIRPFENGCRVVSRGQAGRDTAVRVDRDRQEDTGIVSHPSGRDAKKQTCKN
ncbi:MAG TPA: radical SAM protein [bacterium]|nr:radical SAM protein [bacterium]